MKKEILVLLLFIAALCGLPPATQAQVKPDYTFGHNFYFNFVSTDTRMMVRQPSIFSAKDDQLYQAIDFKNSVVRGVAKDVEPVSPIMLGVKLNPNLADFYSAPAKSLSKEYSSYIIADS